MITPLRRAWGVVPDGLRAPLSILATTFHLYFEDGCTTYAAAIAYYAIFSLVPLALIILSVFGLAVGEQRIVRFVFDVVPLKETASVEESVNNIVHRAHDASTLSLTFGVVALSWSASGIFAAVRSGLNVASHRVRPRPYWRGKLVDLALIPVLGLLIILSIGMTAVAQFAIERTGDLGPLTTNRALLVTTFIVPAVISFVLFLLLYRLVPTARPRWPEAIAGACFATVLFEAAKNLYAAAIALTPFTTDTAIYAGFGTGLVFLLWMFINASILLLGSEFGRAVTMHSTLAAPRAAAQPSALTASPEGPATLPPRP